jgi:hypothetical protein
MIKETMLEKERLIGKFKLQLFAEGDDNTDKTDDKIDEKDKTDDKTDEKKYTQKELNDLITKESRKSTEKLLKEMGFTDFTNAKDGMTKFKEWSDSQKSELDKLKDMVKDYEGKITTYELKIKESEYRDEILKIGVEPTKIGKVLKLVKLSDKEEFKDALEEVKSEFPELFTSDKSDKTDDKDKDKDKGKKDIGKFSSKNKSQSVEDKKAYLLAKYTKK